MQQYSYLQSDTPYGSKQNYLITLDFDLATVWSRYDQVVSLSQDQF